MCLRTFEPAVLFRQVIRERSIVTSHRSRFTNDERRITMPTRHGSVTTQSALTVDAIPPIIGVMEDSVRWTIRVSPETDQAVRLYLGRRGARRADLSRLIEEALRAQIFEKTVERVKRRTAHVGYAQLKAIVREAVQYARRTR